MSRSLPHPGWSHLSLPHLDTGDQNTPRDPPCCGQGPPLGFQPYQDQARLKPPAQLGKGAPRPKRWLRVPGGSLCHICNKLALQFPPPPPWLLLGCLRVSVCALGEKLYNLKLSINLSVKWRRTQGGTTTLKNLPPPHCRAVSGFQTARSHPFFFFF